MNLNWVVKIFYWKEIGNESELTETPVYTTFCTVKLNEGYYMGAVIQLLIS